MSKISRRQTISRFQEDKRSQDFKKTKDLKISRRQTISTFQEDKISRLKTRLSYVWSSQCVKKKPENEKKKKGPT